VNSEVAIFKDPDRCAGESAPAAPVSSNSLGDDAGDDEFAPEGPIVTDFDAESWRAQPLSPQPDQTYLFGVAVGGVKDGLIVKYSLCWGYKPLNDPNLLNVRIGDMVMSGRPGPVDPMDYDFGSIRGRKSTHLLQNGSILGAGLLMIFTTFGFLWLILFCVRAHATTFFLKTENIARTAYVGSPTNRAYPSHFPL
jgi:hypothetical protein